MEQRKIGGVKDNRRIRMMKERNKRKKGREEISVRRIICEKKTRIREEQGRNSMAIYYGNEKSKKRRKMKESNKVNKKIREKKKKNELGSWITKESGKTYERWMER